MGRGHRRGHPDVRRRCRAAAGRGGDRRQGAAAGGCPRPHLLSATTHDGSIVLAQRQIPDKGSEISKLAALVAELDLVSKVVTVDASTLRAGTAPQAMAIIRNTLIAAFRLAGWTNLKKARRHFSHSINRCVDLITNPVETVKIKHDRALG